MVANPKLLQPTPGSYSQPQALAVQFNQPSQLFAASQNVPCEQRASFSLLSVRLFRAAGIQKNFMSSVPGFQLNF
jgi:hypothetical protein